MRADGYQSPDQLGWSQATITQLISAIALVSTAVFAAFMVIGRAFFQLGGELVQLTMIAGVVGIGCVLVSSQCLVDSRFGNFARYARPTLTVAAVMAVVAWSPGVALAALLIAGLAACHFCDWIAVHLGLTNFVIPDTHDPAEALNAAETETRLQEPPTSVESESNEDEVDEEAWLELRANVLKNPSVTHLLSRWRSDDGSESVVAMVRCQIQPNQQNETIHIPVWPFFQTVPDVYCEVIDGPVASVKTTERKQHGLRLDVRIEKKPTEATELVLEIVASAESVDRESDLPIAESDAA